MIHGLSEEEFSFLLTLQPTGTILFAQVPSGSLIFILRHDGRWADYMPEGRPWSWSSEQLGDSLWDIQNTIALT